MFESIDYEIGILEAISHRPALLAPFMGLRLVGAGGQKRRVSQFSSNKNFWRNRKIVYQRFKYINLMKN